MTNTNLQQAPLSDKSGADMYDKCETVDELINGLKHVMDDQKQDKPVTKKIISDEAIESACEVLRDNIFSCDSGESDQQKWLQEAHDFLWSHHFTQKTV